MRRISKRCTLLALVGLAATGCTDQVPTLTDPDLFPGSLPTTIQYSIGPTDLLGSAEVIPGRTTVQDVFFKLIARDFDAALNSNLVAQFNGFPKAVALGTAVDSTYTYEESFVVASLPDTLRVSADLLEFQLWTITQPFDSVDVTWENAFNKPGQIVRWQQPGGTRGTLLGTAIWARSGTGTGADSLRWTVPANVVAALADSSLAGLMVSLSSPNSRAEISSLVMEARVRPETRDTVVTQTITSQAQTFVYTPEPEKPANVLRIGGISSDRVHFRLRLDSTVPACADGSTTCSERLDLRSVTINRVDLVMDPVPVTRGYRPITPTRLSFRRLLEPELGSRATLGDLITADDTVSASAFLPSNTAPVSINLTAAISSLIAVGEEELSMAVLIEPEASTPSYVWFRPTPRLRLVYTLPQRPQLP